MPTKPSENQNSSTKSIKSRRRALLALTSVTATASLPSQWKKPLVDSIIVPTHAQATGPAQAETTTQVPAQSETTTQVPLEVIFSDDGITLNVPIGNFVPIKFKNNQPWYSKAPSIVASNANAAGDGKIKFYVSENQEFIENIFFRASQGNLAYFFSGSLAIGETAVLNDTCDFDSSAQVTVSGINNNSLSYTINFGGTIFSGVASARNISVETQCDL